MSELVEHYDHPPLHEPILVIALDGWIDAGIAAGNAMATLLGSDDTEPIAIFDADALLDHRARRPVMSLTDGVMDRLAWPSIELRAITDVSGHHVLALVGAEPDHSWRRFTDTVVETALDLEVRMVVGLGAYPAPVPHTRDARLSVTSPSSELVDSFPSFTRGSVEVPAGVQASIEMAAFDAGIPAIGLWAQVPHYITGMADAAGSIALIEGLNLVGGLDFGVGELAVEAQLGRERLNQLVAGNEQHQAMIRQLEEMYDESHPAGLGPLPTGDELAAELQAFLRDHGDGS